jgi:ubiquinone/menaquinone biosynthesis C-methylase UbiE
MFRESYQEKKDPQMDEPHIFDPKHIETLESEERKTWQNREEIIQLLKLKPSYIVADLGCGSGYFTIPLSAKVKKIYAIDVQNEMLEYLGQKIQNQKIDNIELLLSKENKIPLTDGSVDLIITVNTFHEFRTKEKIIEEILRVLRDKGKVVVIDFKKEDTGFGPPVSIRVSKDQVKQAFQENSFSFVKSHEFIFQYLVVFQKIGRSQ